MDKKPQVLRVRRALSKKFKKSKVLEFEKGLLPVQELCSLFIYLI